MLLNHAADGGAVGLVAAPAAGSRGRLRAVELDRYRRSEPRWIQRTIALLVAWEVVAAAALGDAVLLVQSGRVLGAGGLAVAGTALAWPLVLGVTGAYSSKLLGAGSEEYRRVLRGGVALLAVVGFASYAGTLELTKPLVVVGLPLLTVVTLLGRLAVRCRLRRLWVQGIATRRVLLVGRGHAVLELAAQLDRERYAGLQVVAACVTEADRERVAVSRGLPVGGLHEVLDLARAHDVDAIAVTSSSETAADYLRRLSWQMEGTGLELFVAPGLIEVAGPRLHIRPLEGLPLLSIEEPRFEGWPRIVKGLVDRTIALTALVVLAPAFLLIALAVGLSSPGPILYRQERIGVNGRRFTMLKFRSMVVDADQRLAALQTTNESDGLLFKMRRDPRITPVGRWLRRLSLDELPQLLNIVGGSMALVGPRPPLPAEVERYDASVRRRLLVKPGLTGLWQISGRSDLPWEEAVRLDLRYVENWTLALDIQILWKTFAAVVRARGAY